MISGEKNKGAELNRKKVIQILLLILLLGFSLRLARCYLVDNFDEDGVSYIRMGQYFAQGEIKKAIEIRPEIPLLYTYLVGVGTEAGFSAEYSGKYINFIAGLFIILALFLIARNVFNDKIALTAAFLGAVHPDFIEESTGIMRESLALCFMMFGLYFAMSAIKKFSWIKWCVAGLFTGLCALTRPEGMELLLVIPVWLVISFIFYSEERKDILLKALPGFILFIIFFFIVVFPVQIYFQKYGSIYNVLIDTKMLRIYLGV